jgi:hypothetical protein
MATGDGIAVFPALDALVTRMEAGLARLEEQQDPRRFFHETYLRTTRAVGAELKRGGFLDPGWVERWDVAFARFYLDALEASMQGGHVPGPWAAAFGADTVPPLRHVLLGMNAHINYDLPQALLAVISDAEFDDQALLTRREADHRHIDQVLAELVDGGSGLGWANRLATKRFLAEARAKVWVNTSALTAARRRGALEARLGELERLSTAKVAELTRPGPVLLRLAVRGFGVTLPDKKGDR